MVPVTLRLVIVLFSAGVNDPAKVPAVIFTVFETYDCPKVKRDTQNSNKIGFLLFILF